MEWQEMTDDIRAEKDIGGFPVQVNNDDYVFIGYPDGQQPDGKNWLWWDRDEALELVRWLSDMLEHR